MADRGVTAVPPSGAAPVWDEAEEARAFAHHAAALSIDHRGLELRAVRLVARRTLARWPSAAVLTFSVSDQGSDAMWADEVRDADGVVLADLFDEEDEVIYAATEELLDDDGPWTKYRVYLNGNHESPALDVRAAAAIDDDEAGVKPPGAAVDALRRVVDEHFAGDVASAASALADLAAAKTSTFQAAQRPTSSREAGA